MSKIKELTAPTLSVPQNTKGLILSSRRNFEVAILPDPVAGAGSSALSHFVEKETPTWWLQEISK